MFSEELHAATVEIWQASKDHPFIQELVAGTLPEEIFRYYLLQDCYYLIQFGNAHVLLAEKATDPEFKAIQIANATGLEESEVSVRNQFFQDMGITTEEYQAMPVAPTAYHYTSHIYRHLQTSSQGTILAALLPCYWLYDEIGASFADVGSPHPIYQSWIDTYNSPEFKELTHIQINWLNHFAATASNAEKAKMKEAFIISSRLELQFWEMAYQKEKWGN
ncbi:thiaminase II [Vagococcus salmoninarum]|uniref:thiaminase II n=1 Tax=Vagococcus salmoninarum TaxID=2739 RepID=UPI003F9DC549